MTVRAVEGKLPYTGGKAITVDENKVISLNLRDENNLIIYDQGDNEIYVDLQLPAGIRPNYAFPVGITTGRVLVADDWDVTGTIIVAKTTSGDVIKLLYGDDGTLWMDNGTGLFKQIYFKADVDLIITNLTNYINTELAKKQNGVSSVTAPTNPQPGDLWYNTSTNEIKVWKGTNWEELGGGSGDVQVSTDTGNLLTTGVKLWLGDKSDFDDLGSLDANTIYAPIEGMGGGLPDTYQEVEYIQSSGTQYMVIGTSFKTNYKVVIDFQMTVTGGDQVPIGIHYTNGGTNVRFGVNAYNSYIKVDGGGDRTNTIAEDTNRHVITIDTNAVTVDGANYITNYTNYTFSQGIGVFCYNEYHLTSPYTCKSSNRLYKLDIYDENGSHIYDLVPCYRIADSVIGLYDLVNSQFYTNAGSGTFTKGNDVN